MRREKLKFFVMAFADIDKERPAWVVLAKNGNEAIEKFNNKFPNHEPLILSSFPVRGVREDGIVLL